MQWGSRETGGKPRRLDGGWMRGWGAGFILPYTPAGVVSRRLAVHPWWHNTSLPGVFAWVQHLFGDSACSSVRES